MCIAIVKPKEVTLTKAVLKNCFKNNPHGAGFAYPTKKGVVIEKGWFNFRAFWARFRSIQAMHTPMLIHFRVATSGEIDKKNCHPWKIDTEHALIHNGVVQDKLGTMEKGCSDTGVFTKSVFRPTFKRSKSVWKTSAYKWLIEETIGKKNKMAVMDSQGDYIIFNESEGLWENGAWFSNDTFKVERKNLHALGTTWIEEQTDGRILSVRRKGGVLTYKEVKNPIVTVVKSQKSANEKIMAFVQKQVGAGVKVSSDETVFNEDETNSKIQKALKDLSDPDKNHTFVDAVPYDDEPNENQAEPIPFVEMKGLDISCML